MYNTDSETPPKKPLVTSLAAAIRETEAWLKSKQPAYLTDAEGTHWSIHVEHSQVPDEGSLTDSIWHLRVRLTADVTATELVKSGVLNREKDQRLVEMMGDEQVRLSMRPLDIEAHRFEEARSRLGQTLVDLERTMEGESLKEIKQQLICQWVDRSRCFGGL